MAGSSWNLCLSESFTWSFREVIRQSSGTPALVPTQGAGLPGCGPLYPPGGLTSLGIAPCPETSLLWQIQEELIFHFAQILFVRMEWQLPNMLHGCLDTGCPSAHFKACNNGLPLYSGHLERAKQGPRCSCAQPLTVAFHSQQESFALVPYLMPTCWEHLRPTRFGSQLWAPSLCHFLPCPTSLTIWILVVYVNFQGVYVNLIKNGREGSRDVHKLPS